MLNFLEFQAALLAHGYAYTSDQSLALGRLRRRIYRELFAPNKLRHYPGDTPSDRLRGPRDVVMYDRGKPRMGVGDHLEYPAVRLEPYDTIVLRDRDYHPGERIYHRQSLLDNERPGTRSLFYDFFGALIDLVSPKHCPRLSTIGVNPFMTQGQITTRVHQDGELFVFVWVLNKRGTGGATRLHALDSDDVLAYFELDPGDILAFRDDLFRHSTTPVVPLSHQQPRRAALVCTLNQPETYPIMDNWLPCS
jgi:hypothetical protein